MAAAKPYNPYAYVPGYAAPKVAKAIQTKGYQYTPPPIPKPPAPPPTAPPAPPSSQSSAAAAGAGGTYIPGEGIYAQDSAAAYDAYNAAIAAADKDTQSARAQFGFNADGSNLDPTNSTGLFQRLMRTQAQTSDADREEAVGRGLGSTGLGAQIGEQHDFQNQGDLADLTNNYQSLLAQAMSEKGGAQTTLTNALLAARQSQLAYDLQNQLFNSFNSAGGAGTDSSGDSDSSGSNEPTVYYDPKTKKSVTYKPGGRATISNMYAT
jgi:hypothetical protein